MGRGDGEEQALTERKPSAFELAEAGVQIARDRVKNAETELDKAEKQLSAAHKKMAVAEKKANQKASFEQNIITTIEAMNISGYSRNGSSDINAYTVAAGLQRQCGVVASTNFVQMKMDEMAEKGLLKKSKRSNHFQLP